MCPSVSNPLLTHYPQPGQLDSSAVHQTCARANVGSLSTQAAFEELEAVLAPEDLLADDMAGRAEHAAGQGCRPWRLASSP